MNYLIMRKFMRDHDMFAGYVYITIKYFWKLIVLRDYLNGNQQQNSLASH